MMPSRGAFVSMTTRLRFREVPSPGSVSQTLEVTGAAPTVETETAQVTTTLDKDLHRPGATGGAGKSPKADKEKARDELLASKLSSDLLTLYQCSQKRATTAAGQACNMPKSGKVLVEVQLTAGSSAIVQKLTAAGLAIKSGNATTTVTGEIAISKLQALVEIAEVKSVTKLEQEARHIRPRG